MSIEGNAAVARRLFDRLETSYAGAPTPGEDLGSYLQRTIEMVPGLSSGEQVLYLVAWAIYNDDRDARVADLAKLDPAGRAAVLEALGLWLS